MSDQEKPVSPLSSAGPDLTGLSGGVSPTPAVTPPVTEQPNIAPAREPEPTPPSPEQPTGQVSPAPAEPAVPPPAPQPAASPQTEVAKNPAQTPLSPQSEIPKNQNPVSAQPQPEAARSPAQPRTAPAAGSPERYAASPAASPAPRSFWKKLLSPFFTLPESKDPGPPQKLPVISSPPQATGGLAGSCSHAAGATKPPVVTFRHVTKIFNQGTPQEYKAIQDIDFEIEDLPDVGEFIALVGPSGCGKSTVLNLIQGFPDVWPPTTGEVLVRNKPVTGPGKDRGMIFQKYSSFPNRTVLQNVLFGLELNRDSLGYSPAEMKARSMDMISKVGLIGHENKYPYQLSGGQQQRVAIARTLVLRPRIILMDEPFSALDEPTRIDMQALISSLWHEVEATVFIVTHSLAEAVYLGDRIFIFTPGPGRIAEKIFIKPADIGKERGMSPLDVQEGDKFKTKLHEITGKFLAYEEGSQK